MNMTGIDTNVLVRYLVNDDPVQGKKAAGLFRSLTATNRGFISLVTIVETIWVLESVYAQETPMIIEAILKLVRSQRLVIQCAKEIEEALTIESYGADPADAIIAVLGKSFGCEKTVTFDKNAAKLEGMKLL